VMTSPKGGVDNHKQAPLIVQLRPTQINSRLICARAWRSPRDWQFLFAHRRRIAKGAP
jgi:hypothetical protein